VVKIALLFLVISDVSHQEYWRDFLHGKNKKYSIYVHSKEPVRNSSWFKKHEISIKIPTQWEHVTKAQIALLREALNDRDNQKFIFLSESTIPLQDFETVYDTVMKTSKSIFPFCLNPHQDVSRVGTFWGHHNYQPQRVIQGIASHLQYKNHPWIILNRKHAQLMVDDKQYLNVICKTIIDNEHYPSTFLAIQGLLNEVDPRQMTYDDWIITNSPRSPFVFTDLNDPKQRAPVVKAMQGGLYNNPHKYLFGRKFSENCNLVPIDQFLKYRHRCDENVCH
jgi:hypothetical protein